MADLSPFSLTIFGATGDLTKRKLIPALFSLFKSKLLPSDFRIIAFARRPFTNQSFIETLLPFIQAGDDWEAFVQHIQYFQGDFNDFSSFSTFKAFLDAAEHGFSQIPQRLYYMAVAPSELTTIVDFLAEASLHSTQHDLQPRIIIEKPFGHDLESAQMLNKHLTKYFSESQIYRIDHYLGKETVQNILSVRFANIFLEPVWCRDYIESIEINAFETLGVEMRGGYYDKAGALRDMVQSHLLQIMALTLMEQPLRYDSDEIRSKKNDILRALRPMSPKTIKIDSVRGQYNSYTKEEKVEANSQTETYVGIRAYVDNDKWQNVPIIIRTGKRLQEHRSEIIVTFKRSTGTVFSNLFCELRSNTLKIRLQPDEGVKMRMLIKQPGFEMQLADVYLDYQYKESYKSLPDAYERLLLDAIQGDQSLFTRTDEIESSWRYITNIHRLWESEDIQLQIYEVGSTGVNLPD